MVLKLKIEPIPSQNWGISLAKLLPKEVWDSLRREVYELSGYICSICGEEDKRLHCHERWVYNDKRRVQKLAALECICVDCHDVKHWGRTSIVKPSEVVRLLLHFCTVNSSTKEEFEAHLKKVNAQVRRRSKLKYKVNFGKFSPEEVVRIWKSLRDQG